MEIVDGKIQYSAGKAVDVRKIIGISQEETLRMNIVQDGQAAPLTGFIQPKDLLIAMQLGTTQSEEGLVYAAVYGIE